MSFPRYPKYKDSGVEWLGEVPEHWRTFPLKAVSTHNDDVLDETTEPDTEIAYVDISSVDGVNGINAKETMLFSAAPSRARRRVKHGDVIVSTVRTYLKSIARICDPEENLIVSTGFAVIRPRGELTSDFLGCLVFASYFVEQVIARSTGVSYPAINASELVAIPVPIPPLHEQTLISAFLDQETAKIDDLVGEQRRLIELLKEKRQAVISHAVTKGLNPHAPMKPSGIEWLGDVPEHWKITPLKWLTDPDRPIMYGIVLPGPDVGEGIPILKGGNVRPSRMNLQSMARTTQEIETPYARARLKAGDLVYSIRGSIGDCEPVPAELEGSNITQDVARVAIANGVCASWARWALLASAIRDDLACGSLGAAVRGINIFDLKRANIPTPPPGEQAAITAFVNTETAKLDTLTAEAQRAIDLLQERRTALISAAVTGKIDIREFAQ
ncbi:MAG: restriction endonuclease subunit S [Planctomycetota bacterium]